MELYMYMICYEGWCTSSNSCMLTSDVNMRERETYTRPTYTTRPSWHMLVRNYLKEHKQLITWSIVLLCFDILFICALLRFFPLLQRLACLQIKPMTVQCPSPACVTLATHNHPDWICIVIPLPITDTPCASTLTHYVHAWVHISCMYINCLWNNSEARKNMGMLQHPNICISAKRYELAGDRKLTVHP